MLECRGEQFVRGLPQGGLAAGRRRATFAMQLRLTSEASVGEEVGGGTMESRGRRHHGAGSASQISGSGRTKHALVNVGLTALRGDRPHSRFGDLRSAIRYETGVRRPIACGQYGFSTTGRPWRRSLGSPRAVDDSAVAAHSGRHTTQQRAREGTANCVTKCQRPCLRWTMVIPSAAHRGHESPVTSLSCKVARWCRR